MGLGGYTVALGGWKCSVGEGRTVRRQQHEPADWKPVFFLEAFSKAMLQPDTGYFGGAGSKGSCAIILMEPKPYYEQVLS